MILSYDYGAKYEELWKVLSIQSYTNTHLIVKYNTIITDWTNEQIRDASFLLFKYPVPSELHINI